MHPPPPRIFRLSGTFAARETTEDEPLRLIEAGKSTTNSLGAAMRTWSTLAFGVVKNRTSYRSLLSAIDKENSG